MPLPQNFASEDAYDLVHLFIDDKYSSRFVPLPVYSGVKPSQTQWFLVHLLVSMGSFDCEYDLYQGRCMSDFLFSAGLLSRRSTEEHPVTQVEVDSIMREYILKQLMFLPGGTKSFDRYCELTHEVVSNALIHGVVSLCGTPGYLYTSLLQDASEECLLFWASLQRNIAEAVVPHVHLCSAVSDLLRATKRNTLGWRPKKILLFGQSAASYEEEVNANQLLIDGVDSYCACQRYCTKNVMIAGGPESGKTYSVQVAALYAMS